MNRLAAGMFAVVLLAGGCALVRSAVDTALEDEVVRCRAIERIAGDAPHLARVQATNAFRIVVDEVVAGTDATDERLAPLARLVGVHLFGETFDERLAGARRGDDPLQGFGFVTITGYLHAEGDAPSSFVIGDMQGSLNITIDDGPRGDTLGYVLVASHLKMVVDEGIFPFYCKILPGSSSHGERDPYLRRMKSANLRWKTLERSDLPVRERDRLYEAYLRGDDGPGPIIRIDGQLYALADGSYTFSFADRYPVYVRVPSAELSSNPAVRAAVDGLAAEEPGRFHHYEGGVELRLGHIKLFGDTTGSGEQILPPALIEIDKRIRFVPIRLKQPVRADPPDQPDQR